MVELHERLSKAHQIIRTLETELREADRGLMALTEELEARAAALEESESRFRLMVEGSEEVFFYIHDQEGRFTYLSPSVERVLGYSPDELLGERYEVLLTDVPENRHVVTETEAALSSRRQGEPYTAVVRHRTGRVVCLELVEQPMTETGVASGMQGFARDVTERMRRQDALRETTRVLNALIEASPAAIYVLDREGRVELWNPAAQELFGWSGEEAVGRTLPTTDDEDEFHELMRRSLDGEAFSALDLRRTRRDGRHIDITVSTAPLYATTGTTDGVVVVAVDVSEKKALEEQLLRAQKMEAIGRLAGGVAHDFNNILTAMKGHADFALDHLGEASAARDEVEEVRRSADRAAALTSQLLAFSRQQVVRPKVVDLAGEVQEMEKMVRRIIGEDVALDARLAEGRVCMDPSQIHQVILNLVVNARDAMPEGGRLAIEVVPSTIHLDGAAAPVPPGDYLVLTVRDTGQGMDAATQEHIFEPFFTTKERGKGTGLGLATVYGIVTSAGGEIQVRSDAGEGTTFMVYLPRVEEEIEESLEPEGGAVAASRAASTPGTATILVVEDEASVRELVARILRRQGYDVVDVPGPREALRLDAEQLSGIDLVLSDVVMPEMNGRELVESLQLRPGLPVVFMSGYAHDEVIRRGVAHESVSFIGKPFSPVELVEKVREALGFAGMERGTGRECDD